MDMLILDRRSEPLDENIVAPAPFTIHADGDACFFEPPGEGFAGELATLIRIEDLRLPYLARVSSSASRQKDVSMVIDSFQAKTRRLNHTGDGECAKFWSGVISGHEVDNPAGI
jgi:hypothetical protein